MEKLATVLTENFTREELDGLASDAWRLTGSYRADAWTLVATALDVARGNESVGHRPTVTRAMKRLDREVTG